MEGHVSGIGKIWYGTLRSLWMILNMRKEHRGFYERYWVVKIGYEINWWINKRVRDDPGSWSATLEQPQYREEGYQQRKWSP